jgi:hypothetical protein
VTTSGGRRSVIRRAVVCHAKSFIMDSMKNRGVSDER